MKKFFCTKLLLFVDVVIILMLIFLPKFYQHFNEIAIKTYNFKWLYIVYIYDIILIFLINFLSHVYHYVEKYVRNLSVILCLLVTFLICVIPPYSKHVSFALFLFFSLLSNYIFNIVKLKKAE